MGDGYIWWFLKTKAKCGVFTSCILMTLEYKGLQGNHCIVRIDMIWQVIRTDCEVFVIHCTCPQVRDTLMEGAAMQIHFWLDCELNHGPFLPESKMWVKNFNHCAMLSCSFFIRCPLKHVWRRMWTNDLLCRGQKNMLYIVSLITYWRIDQRDFTYTGVIYVMKPTICWL